MRARLFLASLLLPAAALAAVEVTPQAGYRSGALEIDTGIRCIQAPCPTLAESEDGVIFGALVGVPLSDAFQFELLVNRQATDLFLQDLPGGGRNGPAAAELDVTHLHAGVSHVWRGGRVQPFVALGAGQTWIDSGARLIGDVDLQAWSGSLAGGVRVPLGDSNRYALRAEARGYWVDLPGDRVVGDEFVRALEGDLRQIETTVGLTFRLFKPRPTRRTTSSSPRASG